MDLLLFARYRRGGGDSAFGRWEFSATCTAGTRRRRRRTSASGWSRGSSASRCPSSAPPLVNNITHWGYGVLNGAPFGIVAGSLAAPRVRYGALFGACRLGTSYVVLPAAKLYKPIWEYDLRTLGKDLSAHLVYGLSTAAAFKLLSTARKGRS